jgi:hypothetical protein
MGSDIEVIQAIGYVIPKTILNDAMKQEEAKEVVQSSKKKRKRTETAVALTDQEKEEAEAEWDEYLSEDWNEGDRDVEVMSHSSYHGMDEHDCYFIYAVHTKKVKAQYKIGGSTLGLVDIKHWETPTVLGGARLPSAIGMYYGPLDTTYEGTAYASPKEQKKHDKTVALKKDILDTLTSHKRPDVQRLGRVLSTPLCHRYYNKWIFTTLC